MKSKSNKLDRKRIKPLKLVWPHVAMNIMNNKNAIKFEQIIVNWFDFYFFVAMFCVVSFLCKIICTTT